MAEGNWGSAGMHKVDIRNDLMFSYVTVSYTHLLYFQRRRNMHGGRHKDCVLRPQLRRN